MFIKDILAIIWYSSGRPVTPSDQTILKDELRGAVALYNQQTLPTGIGVIIAIFQQNNDTHNQISSPTIF